MSMMSFSPRTWSRFRRGLLVIAGSIALGLGLTAPAQANDDVSANIVGGGPATEDYPFMASIQNNGQHYCGASLVSDRWLVTAAHCTSSGLSVRLGSHDRSSGGEVVPVERYINHPSYGNGSGYDIALLELSYAVDYEPVTMTDSRPSVGSDVRLLGWGQTCPERGCDSGSQYLKQLDTSVISNSNCQTAISGDLCINGTTQDTACYGDSGGPALVNSGGSWTLVGDTSRAGGYDSTCGRTNVIYTSVADYRGWIDQYVDGDDPGDPGDPGNCTDYDSSESGTLSSGGQNSHPGSPGYFYSSSGSHSGCLSGESGTDFDLYLQSWTGSSWQTVASSTSADSEETVDYSGSAGYYRWVAYSYSGSGGYSIGWNE